MFSKYFKRLTPLLTIGILFVILISLTNVLTNEKIEKNKQLRILPLINDVLKVNYDNNLLEDQLRIDVPVEMSKSGKINVYRAYLQSIPVGSVFMPITASGYAGPISIAVGIDYDGRLLGVHVLSHRETIGFGAQLTDNNSSWLLQFEGYNTTQLPEHMWNVKKSGGQFDSLSGATITSQSLAKRLYTVLAYYQDNRALIFQ